jgi:hypothetical protein
MYHWQSEHECGTCMMVLRAVRDVLSNTYHDRWTDKGGSTAWPPRSMPDLNPLYFYLCGHVKALEYAAPPDNEETPHRRIVGACQTIRNYPDILERTRRSASRALNLMEDILSTYYKCTPSAITHKLNVSGYM